MALNIDYYNLNFEKDIVLPNNNKETTLKISNLVHSLPCLNIVKNLKLLEETISKTKEFSQDKTTFMIFGTGGSNLGARALVNILQGRELKKIIFYDNIDPINFRNYFEKIDLNNTGFIIISKSGSTPETLSQLTSIIELYDQKKILNKFFKSTLVITEIKDSPLWNIANDNKCTIFKHEKDIGGRYSIFSNVGMVPAIIAGLDVRKIYSGALDIISKKNYDDLLKLANYFAYQKTNPNLSISVLMTYSDALFYFGKWYLQLWAESIGKKGKGLTAIHAMGTTDQHSQLQLYLDGPKDKFFTIMTTDYRGKGMKSHFDTTNSYNINYLNNKTMGDLMYAEQQATIDIFNKNKFSIREINIPIIDEFSMGQLMTISMIETISTCIKFEVNPFDQPAVEQGKVLTKKYLS